MKSHWGENEQDVWQVCGKLKVHTTKFWWENQWRDMGMGCFEHSSES